ncbi:cytochrome b [Pseudoruegeria sp. HB172150]|uniref:cytochrome b n=1 Tax=Pseudoruegeria sp. HB172150 TaxID=2721164 RepID=UPI00155387CD|nr:cytochrome b/b6 domain-containing protein [Pseudoruegeria sp. HB172150]
MPEGKAGYSTLQISLHWLVAVLIAAAWFSHDQMRDATRAIRDTGWTGFADNPPHVWLGTAVFVLVLIRLVVRAVQGAPEPADGTPKWMEITAVWGHRLLYLLMLFVPLSGSAAWYFGLREAGEVHETIGNLLVILALAHAAVAIFHQYVMRDGTLTRMIRARG